MSSSRALKKGQEKISVSRGGVELTRGDEKLKIMYVFRYGRRDEVKHQVVDDG